MERPTNWKVRYRLDISSSPSVNRLIISGIYIVIYNIDFYIVLGCLYSVVSSGCGCRLGVYAYVIVSRGLGELYRPLLV